MMKFSGGTSRYSTMFSAQDIRRVQPVAPRVQVSNFQLPGSNAAYIPALYRGNVAFAPFEPVANVSASTLTYHSLCTHVGIYHNFGHYWRPPNVYINILSSSLRTTHTHGQYRVSANTSFSNRTATAFSPKRRRHWLFLCNAAHPSTQSPACLCKILKSCSL